MDDNMENPPILIQISNDTIFANFLGFLDSLVEEDMLQTAVTHSMNTYSEELFKKSDDWIMIQCEKEIVTRPDDQKCRICLEAFQSMDSVYHLPCHHRFHCDCLEEAVQRQHVLCPMCRASIPVVVLNEGSSDHDARVAPPSPRPPDA